MPKKKTVKKTQKKATSSSRMDEHSFLIIVGGGFVILMIIIMFLMSRDHIKKLALYQQLMSNSKEVMMDNQKVVSVKGFAFAPNTLTVKVGDTVTWKNDDTVSHDVVSSDEMFDTKMLKPGEKGSYTFTKVGTYLYNCGIHPSMNGTVVVEE